MFIAQLSDLHFRHQGTKLYDFIDVNAANGEIINRINALAERPDAVIITGDIVNCGEPGEYRLARRMLGMLDYPLYVIPGNHDNKAFFLDAFSELCPQLGQDPENIAYQVDDFPVRLLFIDSSVTGAAHGHLSENTLRWLERALSQDDKESYVFMHHPPLAFGSAQMDPIACDNGMALLALIERFGHLTRIFCGHVHRMIATQYRQALICSAPATVHQVPYYHSDDRAYYSLEPGAMMMHNLVDGVGLVSSYHSLAHYAGPWLYDPRISCPLDTF
ncbi:phosphodiesterase [Sodalis sp. dw_96]|uniref:phosphodiesterase n=1 Tax=Sodalis sp. dw_96 TaxID=2719794 RepID=UPI001BD2D8B7|nr:phosphodiesterase [Sodalis sp. dw_96]